MRVREKERERKRERARKNNLLQDSVLHMCETTKLMSIFAVIICGLHTEPEKIINAVDLEVVIQNSVFSTEEQFISE